MNAQEFDVIKPHVSADRFVNFRTMHHVTLDEIKHYLDFKGLFPYMIEKIQFNHFYRNPVLFFVFFYKYIKLNWNIGIKHSKL